MTAGGDHAGGARARVRALIAAEPPLLAGAETGPARAPGHPAGSPVPQLARLCRAAARALPASGVGINLMTETGDQGTAATSDAVAVELEDLQFTLGEGPCVDAFEQRRPVLVPVLEAAAGIWPVYVPAAYRLGVRAVFGFPIQIGAVRLGVLDVYRTSTGHLAGPALDQALAFAEAALDTMVDERPGGIERVADDVYDAGHRAELYQAQGMVMVQLGVDLGEAMARLRAYAFAHDRPLNDVAVDVLSGVLQLGRDAGPARRAGDRPGPAGNGARDAGPDAVQDDPVEDEE